MGACQWGLWTGGGTGLIFKNFVLGFKMASLKSLHLFKENYEMFVPEGVFTELQPRGAVCCNALFTRAQRIGLAGLLLSLPTLKLYEIGNMLCYLPGNPREDTPPPQFGFGHWEECRKGLKTSCSWRSWIGPQTAFSHVFTFMHEGIWFALWNYSFVLPQFWRSRKGG